MYDVVSIDLNSIQAFILAACAVAVVVIPALYKVVSLVLTEFAQLKAQLADATQRTQQGQADIIQQVGQTKSLVKQVNAGVEIPPVGSTPVSAVPLIMPTEVPTDANGH